LAIDSQDTLKFSVLAGVRSMNEVFPLEQVVAAQANTAVAPKCVKFRFAFISTHFSANFCRTTFQTGTAALPAISMSDQLPHFGALFFLQPIRRFLVCWRRV